ncbi:hypothetical protein [Actinokineospora sp.]|uniref:hypothetical protein n=1 Tax=Actinokineospora sp. TaxID=1872133 RepID=UPI004037EA82
MLPRRTAWPALLLAALTLPACATPAASPRPPAPARSTTTAPPTTTSTEVLSAVLATVRMPKRVPAILDCAEFVPALARVTGTRVTVKADESSAELCRYRLPYPRGTTGASILFRAEPPGTPSYQPIGDLFGNTAYQVGGVGGKDCGLSVALDPGRQPHEHGSHLTVLGTYEGVEQPCALTRKAIEAVFNLLADG